AIKALLQVSFGVGHPASALFEAIDPRGFGDTGIHIAEKPRLNGRHCQTQGDFQWWADAFAGELLSEFGRRHPGVCRGGTVVRLCSVIRVPADEAGSHWNQV